MQSNTEKNKLFDFNNEERIKIEEMFVNHKMMDVVKELMELNNIKTKAELASKMGVSRAYISKLFRSDKNFNVNFIVLAQRVFNTTFTFSAKSLQASEGITRITSLRMEEKFIINQSLKDLSVIEKTNSNIISAKEGGIIMPFKAAELVGKEEKSYLAAGGF